jgi:hypothetical protein
MDLGPKLGNKLPTEYLASIEPIVPWAILAALLVAMICIVIQS